MTFTQTMHVQARSADTLAELVERWHGDQAGVAPGYEGARVLTDLDRPGRYVIEVDFSDQEAAERNNNREETGDWARHLIEAVDGEPEYHNYEVAYVTT